MEQTKKDLENIKEKLIEHIRSNYEEEKAQSLISAISEMNDDEFTSFLKEQGLLDGKKTENSKCIFCSIVFGEIPSTIIEKNEKAIAILDINPASRGHTLIIPKEHISSKEKLPEEAGKLALIVEEKIQKALNPRKIEFISSNIMGHEIINVLPIYQDETINSERKKATPEELKEVKEKLDKTKVSEKKEEKKIPEGEANKIEEVDEKNTWLPKRIP